MKYDYLRIEKKWQEKWDNEGIFHSENDASRPKFYALVEFPYPSGNGLHVGHARPYTALDIISRKRLREGFNVLFPIGWDAFGLPTENYAIQNKVHPTDVTRENVKRFKDQCKLLGYSFDWDREINTTDPEYYKWTQWIFLKLYERGLAYKAEMPVNWCTSCKCVLANEEVVDGVCERCGSDVEHREKSQWMLKITDYAQKLLDGLADVDYPERVKAQQANWIGRSEGAEVDFNTDAGDVIKVFTTRPDTLFGATYMVISPEHPLLDIWSERLENYDEVCKYAEQASRKSDFERSEINKDKTGVRLEGVSAINPVNNESIPIFVSDYVLMTYGTGAIMAVPGHDTRDWEFAKQFDLPIIEVVAGGDVTSGPYLDTETGVMVNSGFLNGMEVPQAKEAIVEKLSELGVATATVNYKLRDWVFSRQRYWGEPIPIINCPVCGHVPLEESDLPLVLPEVESYELSDSGESPLHQIRDWVEVDCPKCGGAAERETDTMPQWAGSSWYFLRYTDPNNSDELASREAMDYWMPVDWYNGGMEHTTLHLLYSRFWHHFLYDIGVVSTREPYRKRTSHGMILGVGGEKMSKSRGNVINPNDIVEEYGADTMRLYIMFIGDFEKAASWSSTAVKGCKRFLDRVWNLYDTLEKSEKISKANETDIHKTIKKVTGDIEDLKFNTAIASMMSLLNTFQDNGASKGDYSVLLQLLNPFAPHITEELWQMLGHSELLSNAPWPVYDEAKTKDEKITFAIQVNGKLRSTMELDAESTDEQVIEAAKSDEKVQRFIADKSIVKTIVVKGKLVNLIAK